MSSGPIPFLWLCGPSGVGKSAVGWEIFNQLSRSGIKTAYLDADQLGLCYPAPAHDPDNHQVKARNLGAVWPTFQAAGVQCLVFSGSVDTPDLVHAYAELVPGTALTLCRLRAGHDTLRDRFLRRGWLTDLADQAVDEADALNRSDFADLRVDTDGLSVPEVARQVRERAGGWPCLMDVPATTTAAPGSAPHTRTSSTGPVPLLWLCGPPAVGKSTVGFEIFMQLVGAGITAAYVDLAQIGFCRPPAPDDPGNHRAKARNLGTMWPTFHAAGARCLIVTGSVNHRDTVRMYTDAVPEMVLTLCRLRAGADQLMTRVLQRGRGAGPGIPGDELKGQPTDRLYRFVERAARDADELEHNNIGALCVDTSECSAQEVAQLVRAQAGEWPDLT